MEDEEITFIFTTVWDIKFYLLVSLHVWDFRSKKKNLSSNNQFWPADVFLLSWTQGKPAAFDVTVLSSLQSTIIANEADTPGCALTYADDRKLAAHDAECREAGLNCLPLSYEVLGGWSETSRRTTNRTACLGDGKNAFSKGTSVATNQLTRSISCQLICGNANMIITRFN